MMSARQNAVLRRFNQSLNNWNVINVRNMNRMFKDARSFNQPLNNWDVSNVDYVHVPRARVVRLLRVILKPIPPPNKKEKKKQKAKK